MVIFGATGDLTKRLVIPALYNLSRTNALPEQFALIGVARSDETAKSWGDNLYAALQSYVGNASAAFNVDHLDAAAWTRLASNMSYISGDTGRPRALREPSRRPRQTRRPPQCDLLSRHCGSAFRRRGGATRQSRTYP